MTSSSAPTPLTAKDVHDAIKNLNARWMASDTDIPQRRSRGNTFGLSLNEPDRVALIKETQKLVLAPLAPPPPKIDWRADGWVTEVQDQDTCGACVAFSTVGSLEARARIKEKNRNLAIALSEAHLFSCGHGASCGGGWTVEAAMAFCQSTGVGQRSDFPYDSSDQECRQISPVVKVTKYSKSLPSRARKTAVANGPVIACMKVYDDFMYYSNGIYSYTSGQEAGNHAVCVVGYDDDDQCWIIKNSWGKKWGEGGFVRIAYGQSIDVDFPFYEPQISLVGTV